MSGGEVEIRQGSELVMDEDVLSFEARAALEQVGSATGFILAFALIAALLPRAGRLLAANASGARGARELERGARDQPLSEGQRDERDLVLVEPTPKVLPTAHGAAGGGASGGEALGGSGV